MAQSRSRLYQQSKRSYSSYQCGVVIVGATLHCRREPWKHRKKGPHSEECECRAPTPSVISTKTAAASDALSLLPWR